MKNITALPGAQILRLPTAAAQPVENHRRRGSYGKKVVSFNTKWPKQWSDPKVTAPAQAPAPGEAEWSLQDLRGLALMVVSRIDKMIAQQEVQ